MYRDQLQFSLEAQVHEILIVSVMILSRINVCYSFHKPRPDENLSNIRTGCMLVAALELDGSIESASMEIVVDISLKNLH